MPRFIAKALGAYLPVRFIESKIDALRNVGAERQIFQPETNAGGSL
jgi:hypothetical protein